MDQETYLRDADLLFLDIETTGLHPDKGAEITEVALLDQTSILIDWHKEKEVEPTSSNQKYIVKTILKNIEKRIIVGHNITFDLYFLEYISRRDNLGRMNLIFIDTLSLARTHVSNLASHTLSALAAHFFISFSGSLHQARTDAYVCRDLFWLLVERFGLTRLRDVQARRLSLLSGFGDCR